MNRDDLIAPMSSLSGYPPGSRTVQAFVAVAEDYADSSGQAVQHGMVPGSHERGGGAECRCGAEWSRWAGRCAVAGPQRDHDEEGGQ